MGDATAAGASAPKKSLVINAFVEMCMSGPAYLFTEFIC